MSDNKFTQRLSYAGWTAASIAVLPAHLCYFLSGSRSHGGWTREIFDRKDAAEYKLRDNNTNSSVGYKPSSYR